MNKLQVEYHLEIYEESFGNDASVSLSATNPFLNFNVGDFIDHRTISTWQSEISLHQQLCIKEIKHIIWEIEDKHISHKLMLCVDIVELKN